MKTLFVPVPDTSVGYRFRMERDGLHVSPVTITGDRYFLEKDIYIFSTDGVYHPDVEYVVTMCGMLQSWLLDLGLDVCKTIAESEVWSAYMDWLSDNRPALRYAIQKIRKNWLKTGHALDYTVVVLYYGHIKETESLLSCPFNNNILGMFYTYEAVAEYREDAAWDEITPAQRRHAVRNWLENNVEYYDVEHLPLVHTWHESQWDFFFRNPFRTGHVGAILGHLVENMLINGLAFTDKDVKYIWKQVRRGLQGDELPEQELAQMWEQTLDIWVDNMQVLYNLWLEDAFNGRDIYDIWYDDYWRYPRDIVIAHNTNDHRLREILDRVPEQNNKVFEKYKPIYDGYKIDITIDGYRFYTTGDEQQWHSHARALCQCVFSAGYYKYSGVIVFVEKDGKPYGTVHCDKGEILQARIDQTDYSKSIMPEEIQDMFLTHVVPQYKVLQG